VVSEPVSAFSTDLLHNLRAGLRLASFRRRPTVLLPSVEQLVALVLIDLVLGFFSDLAQFGLDGYVNLWGLPAALFYLPLLLLAAYVVSRRTQDGVRFCCCRSRSWLAQPITVAATVLGLVADFGWLDLPEPVPALLYRGPQFWWLLTAGFATLCLTRGQRRARLVEAGIVAVVIATPLLLLPRAAIAPLWMSDDDLAQAGHSYAVASEDAFYAQPDILRRSLAALRPGRQGIEDIYFVGVAGYAGRTCSG
jgi:hypothetical protein